MRGHNHNRIRPRPEQTRLFILAGVLILGACTGGEGEEAAIGESTAPRTTAAATTSRPEPTTPTTPVTSSPPTTSAPETTPSTTGATTTTHPPSTTVAPAPRPTEKLRAKVVSFGPTRARPRTRLRVTPTVVRGRGNDLNQYLLDATASTQTPWYVGLRVKSLGRGVLERPLFTNRLSARNGRGDDLDDLALPGLEQCRRGPSPKKFNRNTKPINQCRVFFVPRGQRLSSITLHNREGGVVDWKVPGRMGDNKKTPKAPKGGPAGKRPIRGKAETVAWREGNMGLRVNLRPVSVIKGKKADIADYRLGASDKLATPWYVTFTARHAGKGTTPRLPEFGTRTVAYNGMGQRVRGVILVGSFPKCEDAARPKKFARTGKPIITCSVFLVPNGQEIATVGIIHTNEGNEVTWKVTP